MLRTGLLDNGIDELRLFPSYDILRQLWTESGRVRLVSFLFIDEGSLDFCPLYRLLVLFVRLLFEDGPVTGGLPLGGLATNPFVPGNGILLGLLRLGVSGHFPEASCWSWADSVELLCWKASSIASGTIAFMLGVEIAWECCSRFTVDVCIIATPSSDDNRVELTLLDWCSGLKSERLASFVSMTRSWARVPSSSIFRSSTCRKWKQEFKKSYS